MMDFLLKYSQWIIYFGAIISASGGYLASIKADRESAINAELTRKSQEQVANINNEITGGDSFPFLNVNFYNNGNEVEFKVTNYGKVNLTNVTMEILDNSMGRSTAEKSISELYSDMEKNVTEKTFTILYPSKSFVYKDFNIDGKCKDLFLTIHFYFGNKHLIQSVLMYDYKKSDVRHGEVKIFDGSKILLHYTIDKDFKQKYIVGFNV